MKPRSYSFTIAIFERERDLKKKAEKQMHECKSRHKLVSSHELHKLPKEENKHRVRESARHTYAVAMTHPYPSRLLIVFQLIIAAEYQNKL